MRGVRKAFVVAAVLATAAVAAPVEPESFWVRAFREEFREAWSRAREGRQIEARGMLDALSGRLAQVDAPIRPRFREQLARALEAIGDTTTARRVRAEGRAAPVVAAATPVADDPGARGRDLLALARNRYTALETRHSLYGEALGLLQKVPGADAATHYQRGMCLYGLGRVPEAAREFELAVAADPVDAYSRFELARIAYERHDQGRASEMLQAGLALTIDRQGLELLTDMLHDLKVQKKRDVAIATCQSWVDRCGATGAMTPLVIFLAECREENGELAEAMATYALALREGGPIASGGLARVLRLSATRGAKGLQAALEVVRKQVPPDANLPGYLLLAAGDVARAAKDPALAIERYAAGLKGADRPLFVDGLEQVRADAEIAHQADLVARVDGLLDPAPGRPLMPGVASSRLAANFVFDAMLEARKSGKGIEHALGLALSASFAFVPPGAAAGVPVVRDQPLEARSRDSQRYDLIQPYLTGDLRKTMGVLGAMVPSMPLREPVPPAAERSDAALSPLPTPSRNDPTPEQNETPERTAPAPERDQTPDRAPAPRLAEVGRQLELMKGGKQAVEEAARALASERTTERERLARVLDVARSLPDPIVIDLDGNGRADLTDPADPRQGALFDVAGTGTPQKLQWLAARHDGWLCEDIDGDGRITSGLELFGTAGGFADGFAKLALRDTDGDGVLTGHELDGLMVWVDANGDGRTDPGELVTVQAAGIDRIELPRHGAAASARVNGAMRRFFDVWPRVFEFR